MEISLQSCNEGDIITIEQKVRDWKVSELESVRMQFSSKLESVRIGKCQIQKVSELESVGIGKCQNWKVSESESVRIGKCQNYYELEKFLIKEPNTA